MGDKIEDLPQSSAKPSETDENVMRDVFGKSAKVANRLDVKKVMIQLLIFVVLSLPFVDTLLKKYVSDSEVVMFFVKTILFLLVLMVLQLTSM